MGSVYCVVAWSGVGLGGGQYQEGRTYEVWGEGEDFKGMMITGKGWCRVRQTSLAGW